jgi:hypothetical protein
MPYFREGDGVATSYRDPTALNHVFRSTSPYNAHALLKRKCSYCGIWGRVGVSCSLCATPISGPHAQRTPARHQGADRSKSPGASRGGLAPADVNRPRNDKALLPQPQSRSESIPHHTPTIEKSFAEWAKRVQDEERTGNVRDALLRRATVASIPGDTTATHTPLRATATKPVDANSVEFRGAVEPSSSFRAWSGRSATPTTRINSQLNGGAKSPARLGQNVQPVAVAPALNSAAPSRTLWYARASPLSAMPLATRSTQPSRSTSTQSGDANHTVMIARMTAHEPSINFQSYMQLAAARSTSTSSSVWSSQSAGNVADCHVCGAKVTCGHNCRVCGTTHRA